MDRRIRSAIGNALRTAGSSYAAAFAAGFPESTMYCTLDANDVRHLTSATAWDGYLVYSPIARLIPPRGGLLGSPALTSGYRAHPMSSTTPASMAPLSASPLAAAYT